MTRLLAILVFLPSLALANSFKESVDDAAEALEDAASATRRANPNCKNLVPALTRQVDDLDSIRRGTSERRFSEMLIAVTQLQTQAIQSGCPQKVNDRIVAAVTALNTARGQLDDGEPRDRHHKHHDDDDDDRAPPPPPSGRSVEATLGDLRVVYGERVNGEGGVRVEVTSASLRGLGRNPFYFAGHFRPQAGGNWTEWSAGPQTAAPQDPYVWNNAYSQFFSARELRSFNVSQFVVRISLFDANRNELAFKEAVIDLVGGQQQQQQPVPPSPTPNLARDCGTGDDPGCSMQRGRGWAMDRPSFTGWFNTLRGTNSDLTRADMCKSVLANNFITAKQLGLVLGLFNSDLIRLDVAKLAAPRTVNPMHALGLSTLFHSSLLAADFTKLMSGQQQQQQH